VGAWCSLTAQAIAVVLLWWVFLFLRSLLSVVRSVLVTSRRRCLVTPSPLTFSTLVLLSLWMVLSK
jgi:hypothetical protein